MSLNDLPINWALMVVQTLPVVPSQLAKENPKGLRMALIASNLSWPRGLKIPPNRATLAPNRAPKRGATSWAMIMAAKTAMKRGRSSVS